MSWLPVLFILLALCMIAGPVLMLKPSRWQRHLAHLRSRASSLGLKVHLEQIGSAELAVYQIPWPSTQNQVYVGRPWCLERKPYAHDIHINEFWYWQNEVTPAPVVVDYIRQHLAELPDGAKGVSGNSQGLGCFWDEKGGDAVQEQIAQWLQAARDHLWPLVRKDLNREEALANPPVNPENQRDN